ncbi:MAG: hypothetical protein KA314_25440 [Chloroflexi bacterium]|nr:hypothetical protein [Chloroflexota bacterium]MBP8059193.1 hypothetical protein [Chloroflexota bacterium]
MNLMAVLTRHGRWRKGMIFFASLFLFILAISLMQKGARGLATLLQNSALISNPANGMGFGWLVAYGLMSGSPVAAASLTFFDAGLFDRLTAFAMITGSRLGANFIVLFIGFVYVIRGRDRGNSLGMGILSLSTTGSTYLFSFFLGLLFLRTGWVDTIQLNSGSILSSITDLIFDPIVNYLLAVLPPWSYFPVGMIIILISFNLFDRCLPELTVKESQVGQVSRLVYRPLVMFLLGCGVTLISMSVSVSLSILVPLSNRGFIRRENVIPYIMGANVTTFIDTLLASVLLNNPNAFTVVLVQMISIGIVSLLILTVAFRPYERLLLAFVNIVTRNNRNMALFMFVIFLVPLLLLFI